MKIRVFIFSALAGMVSMSQAQSTAPRTISLSALYRSLQKNHPDLVSARAEVESAKIGRQGVARLDVPVLSASLTRTSFHSEDRSVPAAVDGALLQGDFAARGRVHDWGLGYAFSQAYYNQTQNKFGTFPSLKTDGYEYKLELDYDLLRGSGWTVGHLPEELASRKVRAATLGVQAVSQSLVWEFLSRYLGVLSLQKKIANAEDTLSEGEKLYVHYKNLFSEGRIAKADLLSAEVQVASARAAILALQSEFRARIWALLAYCGALTEDKGGDIRLETVDENLIPASAVPTPGDTKKRANAEVERLIADRKSLESEWSAANDLLRPSLKLVGGQSWRKNLPTGSILTGDDLSQDGWYAGVKLEMPWDFVGARTDAALKRVGITELTAREKLLRENIELKIRGLIVEIASIAEQLKTLEELQRVSGERYRATLPLLEQSSAARLDIFDFQNQLREHRSRIAELRIDTLRLRAQILYLSGIPIPLD